MRRFGTLSFSETLYFGSLLILTILGINILSGLIGFLALDLLDDSPYISFLLMLISTAVFMGGILGIGMKVVSDSISIGMTLHESTKNPFIVKPKVPKAKGIPGTTKNYTDSDIKRAMKIFPGTDESAIREYFNQGWTIEKLEIWASEKKV